MRDVQRFVVSIIVCLLALGCGDETVFFDVDFEDEELRQRAVRVEIELREGGCDGTTAVTRWTFARGQGQGMEMSVPDGSYGLVAHAVDAECRRFAEDCLAVALPTDAISLGLSERETSEYLCSGSTCTDGTCDELENDIDPFRAIGLGLNTTCVIRDDSSLWCWGSNTVGQLGTDDTEDQLRPVVIDSARNWVDVDLGRRHQCAVTVEGEVLCTGENLNGNLAAGDREQRLVHTPIAGGSGPFRTVVTGYDHTLALSESGTASSWGRCCQQLGVGLRVDDLLEPEALLERWAILGAGGTNTVEGGAGELNGHSCGIRTDGTLWCWGGNHQGQLGVGDTMDRDRPTAVDTPEGPWATVATGGIHTCAIRYDGSLWCWGRSANGALGLGSQSGVEFIASPQRHDVEEKWQAVAASSRTTCGVRVDGTLWCWGLNGAMQLGQPDMSDLTASSTPLRAHPEQSWKTVLGGRGHMCGVNTNGELRCWGDNNRGALGRGDAGEPEADAVVVAFP